MVVRRLEGPGGILKKPTRGLKNMPGKKSYKRRLKAVTARALVCLGLVLGMVGCETCRGVVEDVKNIDKVDEWIRDHYW